MFFTSKISVQVSKKVFGIINKRGRKGEKETGTWGFEKKKSKINKSGECLFGVQEYHHQIYLKVQSSLMKIDW